MAPRKIAWKRRPTWEEIRQEILNEQDEQVGDLTYRLRKARQLKRGVWIGPALLALLFPVLLAGGLSVLTGVAIALFLSGSIAAHAMGRLWERRWTGLIQEIADRDRRHNEAS